MQIFKLTKISKRYCCEMLQFYFTGKIFVHNSVKIIVTEGTLYDCDSSETIDEGHAKLRDSIRIGPIKKLRAFQISRTCLRTTNHAHSSTSYINHCAVVIEIYFMFMILCLCSKSIHTP